VREKNHFRKTESVFLPSEEGGGEERLCSHVIIEKKLFCSIKKIIKDEGTTGGPRKKGERRKPFFAVEKKKEGGQFTKRTTGAQKKEKSQKIEPGAGKKGGGKSWVHCPKSKERREVPLDQPTGWYREEGDKPSGGGRKNGKESVSMEVRRTLRLVRGIASREPNI